MNKFELQIKLTHSIKNSQIYYENLLPRLKGQYFYRGDYYDKSGIIKYVAQDFSWFITSWENDYKGFAKFDCRKNSLTKGYWIKAGLPAKYNDINIFKFSDEKIFNIIHYYKSSSCLSTQYDIICNLTSSKLAFLNTTGKTQIKLIKNLVSEIAESK